MPRPYQPNQEGTEILRADWHPAFQFDQFLCVGRAQLLVSVGKKSEGLGRGRSPSLAFEGTTTTVLLLE